MKHLPLLLLLLVSCRGTQTVVSSASDTTEKVKIVRDPPTLPDELTVDGSAERSDNHLVEVVGVNVLPLPAFHRAVGDGTASREYVNEVGRGRQQGDDALSEGVL